MKQNGTRLENKFQGKYWPWTEKRSSKGCSEISSIELNVVSTLQETQYLAKQQTSKVFCQQNHMSKRLFGH